MASASASNGHGRLSNTQRPAPVRNAPAPERRASSSYNRSTNGASSAQIEELNATLVEKNLAIEGLEKERDFYFGKLRDIEVLAQEFETAENAEFSQKVLGVLYATEDGFAVPEEDADDLLPPQHIEEY